MSRLDRKRLSREVATRMGPSVGPSASAPAPGTYLTDGSALFCVRRARPAERGDQLVVELEDCQTLDLYAYPASKLAVQGLRTVTPLTPVP